MQEFSCESCGYHTQVFGYFEAHMMRGHLGSANNSNGILVVKKEWFVEDVR